MGYLLGLVAWFLSIHRRLLAVRKFIELLSFSFFLLTWAFVLSTVKNHLVHLVDWQDLQTCKHYTLKTPANWQKWVTVIHLRTLRKNDYRWHEIQVRSHFVCGGFVHAAINLKCISAGVYCIERKRSEIKSEKVRGEVCILHVEFTAYVFQPVELDNHLSFTAPLKHRHVTVDKWWDSLAEVTCLFQGLLDVWEGFPTPGVLIGKTTSILLHQILSYDWKTGRLLFSIIHPTIWDKFVHLNIFLFHPLLE